MARIITASLALIAASTALMAPAHAWRRGGDDRAPVAGQTAVSRDRAVAIARERGMTRPHEVKFDDGVWEVEGWNARGDKVEFDIHPQTGAILKEEIYRAPR
jgi:hypothetical protein